MMRSQLVATLPVVLLLCTGGCLLPGSKSSKPAREVGFLADYSLLRPDKVVRKAYWNPGFRAGDLRSVRIPDFQDYTGHSVDPQALVLVAEAITTELEALPPSRRPFELIDRSPGTASAWVDLMLEGAVTEYEIKRDSGAWSRLSEQVAIGVECRLVDRKSGAIVCMIQHRMKQKVSELSDENPMRTAMQKLAHDVAQFLAEPGRTDAGEPRPKNRRREEKPASRL